MQKPACVTVLLASVGLTVKVSELHRRLNATCTSVQLHIPHILTTAWLCCSWHIVPVIQLV